MPGQSLGLATYVEIKGRRSVMETHGAKRMLLVSVAAWSCAIAMALAIVTPVAGAGGAAWRQEETPRSVRDDSGDNVAVVVSGMIPSTRVNATEICSSTPYPSACETALSSSSSAAATAAGDPFVTSMQFAMTRAASARALARNLSSSSPAPRRRHSALQPPSTGMDDCAELLDISLEQLGDALSLRGGGSDAADVTTWLSAAMTNQATCGESLAAAPSSIKNRRRDEAVRARVVALVQFIGTALALHSKLNNDGAPSAATALTTPLTNRTTFPSWLSIHDRKLLESTSPATSGIVADAVVALDGSGTHRSISEAIADVTSKGEAGGRKVIHVKAGRYEESVIISSKQKNVMLMGDGKEKTVIVGHKSAADGYTTYATATVAAMGSGFIARGLTIVNSAGPSKGQAVALRVGGDLSVVYQCDILAYQDTLYVHSNRQFYASNAIAGTVDFIFGNAAVVIQNCDIRPRRPGPSQKDTITAQGRTDPNQNTGISIHRCRITAAGDLGRTPVYLGRPWQRYSRTVIMETFLDRSIAAAGWMEWSGQFALGTLYYGEYGNTGPGSGTGGRVRWRGVHTSLSTVDATRFTVGSFIMGNSWLGDTGVTYTSGL